MADKNTVEVLLRLKQTVDKELAKADKAFKKTKKAAENTGKSLKGLGKDAKKGLSGVSREAKKAKQSVEGLGQTAKKTNQGMGLLNATTITLTATIFALSKAVRLVTATFVEFDDTMRIVGAVSNATASQLDDLTSTARKMGATTRFTATQAAEGLRFLAQAGFEVEESMGALPGVLQLASAGALDLGQAADIATNILTGFGRAVDELGDVNDVLVTTFTSTNTNLVELGEAFKLVAPVASAVGSEFNDLSAALGLLANAGLKGTLAGTSLRGSIDALLNPTKQEAVFMEELSDRIGGVGLQVRNAEGNFVGFLSIIKQLEVAGLKGDEALKLFGLRAGPGIAALVNQGSEALEELIISLDESGGTAARIATQMEAGLGGALRELNSAFTELILTIGDDLAPALLGILKALTGLIRAVSKVDVATKLLVASLLAVGSATLAWKLGIARLGPALFSLLTNMEVLRATSLTVANIWKGALIGAIIFAAVEIGKVVIAIFELNKAMKEQKLLMEEINKFWGDNTDALFIHIKTIEELKKLSADQLNEEKENLKSALKGWTVLLNEKRLNGESTTQERDKIRELKKAMDDFVTVAFDKPQKEMDKLQKVTKKTGDEFKKAFKDTVQASDEFYSRAIFRAKEAALQSVITKEEEARRIIALETLKFDDMFRIGQEFAEKAKDLDKNTEENHAKAIELMKKSVEGLEKARLQSLARYQKALDDIKSAEQESIDFTQQFSDSLKALTDKDRSQKQLLRADQKAINKLQKEANALIKSGSKEDLDNAAKKLEASQEIADSLEREVQSRGEIKQTEEEGRKKAIKETKQNIELAEKLGRTRIKNAEEAAEKEKELAKVIGEQLENVQEQLDFLVNQERLVSIDLEVDQASFQSIQELFASIEATPLIKRVILRTEGSVPSGAEERRNGGPVGLATGGTVHGPGGIDKVPAWLTAGEFVIKKDTVEKLGLPYLHAINNMSFGGMMDNARTKYATGGVVGGMSQLGQVSFSRLMKFANGGGVNDIASEKTRISREYDNQIVEAKKRGDEDSALVLEREKIAMEELANELELQMEALNKLFLAQVEEQKEIIAQLEKSKEAYNKLAGDFLAGETGSFGTSDPNVSKFVTRGGTGREFIVEQRRNVNTGLNNEINDGNESIDKATGEFNSEISRLESENKIKEREVELRTQESLINIDRRTQDQIRRLEQQKQDLLNGFGGSGFGSAISGSRLGRQFFEDGGSVHGPGGVDNVPAMLTSGEHVMTKKAVDMLGKPFFDQINNLRIPFPRFQNGGSVGNVPRETSSFKNLGTVNLNIGSKSFQVQGDQSELTDLINTLKNAQQRT